MGQASSSGPVVFQSATTQGLVQWMKGGQTKETNKILKEVKDSLQEIKYNSDTLVTNVGVMELLQARTTPSTTDAYRFMDQFAMCELWTSSTGVQKEIACQPAPHLQLRVHERPVRHPSLSVPGHP